MSRCTHNFLGRVYAFKNSHLGKVWLSDVICSPLHLIVFYFILFYFTLLYFILFILFLIYLNSFFLFLILFFFGRLPSIKFEKFSSRLPSLLWIAATYKQEMELPTCICTSSYFCHWFPDPCWGRMFFFYLK